MPQSADVLAPAQCRVLSGSALKVIAVVSMLIDHVTAHLLAANYAFTRPLAVLGTLTITWSFALRTIGRIAFPIYCFLLVEGFVYTHNRKRYGRNLLVFALLSEVPFDLARTKLIFDPTYQNVFFTLLLGYVALCAFEHFAHDRMLQAVSLIGLAVVSKGLMCDYGPSGYALILVLYFLRGNAVATTTLGCCITSATYRAGLAFIPINLYNGTRGFIQGPVLKFAFYAFYPAHLLVIWMLRVRWGI